MIDVPQPYRIRNIQSRSVTQENPTGGKGLGGKDRGNGNCRKGAPAFRNVQPGETKTLCDIQGPGVIRHIWIARPEYVISPEKLRSYIFRIYWDDSEYPSVEAPMGDFFGVAHGRTAHYMSPYLGMPEGKGFQCYFPMPFGKRCRITVENDSPDPIDWLFYQVDYTLGDEIAEDMGFFHAHFRRENPCPVDKDYCLLDIKDSPGLFVGAVIGVNPKAPSWWGEGEMKFYIDGDTTYPTICGTGAEDYLCSGWGMNRHEALYTGLNYEARDESGQHQFVSFYRFHVMDPIYFQNDLRVELQQLGAGKPEGGECPVGFLKKYGLKGPHIHPDVDNPGQSMSDWLYDRSDDYCSVVFWYQKLTGQPLPPIPSRAQRIKGIGIQPWEQSNMRG
jgi:hypothetical protein